MNNSKEIVEVTKSFRNKIAHKAMQTLGRKKMKSMTNVSYGTISRFIYSGLVRKETLALFVSRYEGPDANIEDFIAHG